MKSSVRLGFFWTNNHPETSTYQDNKPGFNEWRDIDPPTWGSHLNGEALKVWFMSRLSDESWYGGWQRWGLTGNWRGGAVRWSCHSLTEEEKRYQSNVCTLKEVQVRLLGPADSLDSKAGTLYCSFFTAYPLLFILFWSGFMQIFIFGSKVELLSSSWLTPDHPENRREAHDEAGSLKESPKWRHQHEMPFPVRQSRGFSFVQWHVAHFPPPQSNETLFSLTSESFDKEELHCETVLSNSI